jgi:hypothetical protein
VLTLAIQKIVAANRAAEKLQPYNTRQATHIYFNTAARTTALAFCESARDGFACDGAEGLFFQNRRWQEAAVDILRGP